MKKIILNGFNKKAYTIDEVTDILTDLGISFSVDFEFDFASAGKHYIIKTGKEKKKSKKK